MKQPRIRNLILDLAVDRIRRVQDLNPTDHRNDPEALANGKMMIMASDTNEQREDVAPRDLQNAQTADTLYSDNNLKAGWPPLRITLFDDVQYISDPKLSVQLSSRTFLRGRKGYMETFFAAGTSPKILVIKVTPDQRHFSMTVKVYASVLGAPDPHIRPFFLLLQLALEESRQGSCDLLLDFGRYTLECLGMHFSH